MTAVRVLIISHDVVAASMAGPGIRYWELARVLAKHCTVTLAVPEHTSLHGEGFDVQLYRRNDWHSLEAAAQSSDVILPGGTILTDFPELAALDRPLVIDGYDPYPAENLSLAAGTAREEPTGWRQNLLNRLRQECSNGDFFLCASERQRYWWLGLLAAHGRLNPATYRADPTFRNLIDVVPFGLDPEPLQHIRQALKGVIPGIGPDDAVLLWGGGIWEWLDPMTLLRALPRVIARRPDVRLIFPGTRHPSPAVPEMPARQRALDLAAEQGLLGKHVFFGDWVPYADWPNYLLEADIGVSLHLNSLETQLAFRSRVLDYIRAGLPVVVTRGDVTSELVAAYGLGIVVEYEDASGVADAILTLLDEPRSTRQERFAAAQAASTWDQVAHPLIAFCRAPCRAADHEADARASAPTRQEVLSTHVAYLAEQSGRRQAEIERLQALVHSYERGRFIRFMRQVHRWRGRLPMAGTRLETRVVEKPAPLIQESGLGQVQPEWLRAAEPGLPAYDVTPFAAEIDLATLEVIQWAPMCMSRAERLLLYAFIFGLRPARYLEIGTFQGGSALVVAAALDASGNDGRMVCLDPDPHIEPEHWKRIEHRAVLLADFSPGALPRAFEAADGPFDFVLIDGDHTYEGVLRDANGVLPFVVNGAYILFHDSRSSEVARAICDFAAQHPDEIVDFGTLTHEVTFQPGPESEPVQWGGLRLVQIRRAIDAH